MPTFSRSLEKALHRALAIANERSHEYATLEHLLLALVDDKDAAAVMRACSVDLEILRHNLENYIDNELANLVTDDGKGNGAPHVVGVRTDNGDEIRGDLVIDAGGRRSPLPRWLADIGAKPGDEEIEDSGFMYYGRHFRRDPQPITEQRESCFGEIIFPFFVEDQHAVNAPMK